jgi:hypothetical protein
MRSVHSLQASLAEKRPMLRLPVLAGSEPADDERLLKLFWNRAELKKELQVLDDELHNLRNRIKQQEGANSRLQEQLEQLELMLGNPERGPDALVHFGLKNLWRECRAQLEHFTADLRRQRQDHERKRQLAGFQQDREERLRLADERLREAEGVLGMERARLAEGDRKLASMKAFWHYFRRRELAFELDAQRERVASAQRQLEDLQESRRTIEKEPWPEFPGLTILGRRTINLAVIAYAQLLCSQLAKSGLANEAKLAMHRRVEDARFGSRAECLARLDEIAAATAAVRAQEGVAPGIRALTGRLREKVSWRSGEDVVPVPASLPTPTDDGGAGPKVLIDDYWDLHMVLVR